MKIVTQSTEMPPGVREETDVKYSQTGNSSIELNLYVPEKTEKPFALLIFHGGAWICHRRSENGVILAV